MMPIPPIVTRWLVVAAAILGAFAFGWLQGAHHEAMKAARFEAATQALGEAAQAHADRIESAQRAHLEQINHDLTHNLKTARDGAVDNYLRRNPRWLCPSGPGGGAVPGAPPDQPDDDGAPGQRLAANPGFIRACAEDAARLSAWQGWATANSIPVVE